MCANIDACRSPWEDEVMTIELLPIQDVTACCSPVTTEAMDQASAEVLAK